jgi:hypothetical protein
VLSEGLRLGVRVDGDRLGVLNEGALRRGVVMEGRLLPGDERKPGVERVLGAERVRGALGVERMLGAERERGALNERLPPEDRLAPEERLGPEERNDPPPRLAPPPREPLLPRALLPRPWASTTWISARPTKTTNIIEMQNRRFMALCLPGSGAPRRERDIRHAGIRHWTIHVNG